MILRLSLFLLSMLTCSMVWAVGFGNVESKSYLSEPLDIRVPLVLSDEERKSKLQVMLATPQEYKTLEQNIPKTYSLLRADVIDDDGTLSVKVSSVQAIDESFLTIVLKVQRGRGNFYKSIQLFLDPVWHQSKQPDNTKPNVGKNVATTDDVTPIESSPVEVSALLPNGLAVPLSSDWARRTSYGPVQSGDNLSEIAYRLRKDKRFSNHQVMLALFDENPQAFERQDINRLKKGAFLNVPTLQDVQTFLNSPNYQDLKDMLQRKKKKVQEVNTKSGGYSAEQPKRKFHSKVSLGMTESLGATRKSDTSIHDAVILSRLKKLEPLHDQVMASNIRIDSIGVKIDSLAEEVRSLHQKVEALAQMNLVQNNMTQKNSQGGYGWWWFLFLLVLNILLLLFFLYRKQLRSWQDNLEKAQYKHVYDVPELEKESLDDVPELEKELLDDDLIMQPEFADNALDGDLSVLAKNSDDPTSPPHIMDNEIPAAGKEESVVKDLADEEKNERVEEKSEKIYIDHAAHFEVVIQKKDWESAELHYHGMAKNVQMQPRIQASYIQMLHYEKRIIDRNKSLLSLYSTYDQTKWNHFCSLFDDDVWHELQDERVISFTGEVLESGIERSNLAAEEMDSLLAISDLDVLSTSEQEPLVTQDENKEAKSIPDDIMDKTVVMNAKDLAKWNSNEVSTEAKFMDTEDVGKWGKVEETTDDELMLEVDFDVEEELKESEPEEEKVEFTEIDVEFTGEIEPLSEGTQK